MPLKAIRFPMFDVGIENNFNGPWRYLHKNCKIVADVVKIDECICQVYVTIGLCIYSKSMHKVPFYIFEKSVRTRLVH